MAAIVEGLWGDDVPRSAVGIVRTTVWRLRRALADVDDLVLQGTPSGYSLGIDPDAVDALAFERLLARARREADAGRPAEARALLDQALALWRTDELVDLDGPGPLRSAAVRLEQLRLAATEERIDARLALGHDAEVVADLEALTRRHPYREHLWAQLMTALYRSGRQADALAAYQQVRTVLVEEVGVEPGPELRALERAVLDQAAGLGWSGATGGTGPPPVGASPPEDRAFVGRVAERALLARRLDEARAGRFGVVLAAGPPGIGKTALAMWAARARRRRRCAGHGRARRRGRRPAVPAPARAHRPMGRTGAARRDRRAGRAPGPAPGRDRPRARRAPRPGRPAGPRRRERRPLPPVRGRQPVDRGVGHVRPGGPCARRPPVG